MVILLLLAQVVQFTHWTKSNICFAGAGSSQTLKITNTKVDKNTRFLLCVTNAHTHRVRWDTDRERIKKNRYILHMAMVHVEILKLVCALTLTCRKKFTPQLTGNTAFNENTLMNSTHKLLIWNTRFKDSICGITETFISRIRMLTTFYKHKMDALWITP